MRPEVLFALAGLALVSAGAGKVAAIEPGVAILLALALAFVLVSFADLRAGVVVFTVVAFLDDGVLVPHLIAGGMVLGLAWLARVTTARDAPLLSAQPALATVLGLLLGWAALSVVWANDPALAKEDVWRYALNIPLLLVVYTAVRNRYDAWWVAGGFILGAVITSLYGFVVPPETGADPTTRFTGGLGDPNVLAVLLVCGGAIALAAAGAARRYHRMIAIAAFSAAVLCLVGFMLTVSRGGLIAFGAALIAAILIGGRWRVRITLAALLLAVGVGTYVVAFASDSARERLTETTSGEIRVQESRFTTWEIAERMAADNPGLGVGTGNFEASSVDYLFQPGTLGRTDQIVDTPLAAHQTYLHIAAELGIPGLALFLAVTALTLGAALRAAALFRDEGDEPMEILSRAAAIAIVAMLTSSLFISMQTNNKLWLLLALGPALLGVARRQQARDAT